MGDGRISNLAVLSHVLSADLVIGLGLCGDAKVTKALLPFCALLASCVSSPTKAPTLDHPPSAHFYFQCDEDTGDLWAAAVPEGWEEGYAVKVGRCLGNLKIIGVQSTQKTGWKLS